MQLDHEMIVNAPASKAWAVLGEQFGDIGQWSTSIEASSLQGELGVGCVRACHSTGFGPFSGGLFTERLTEFDPQRRIFRYEGLQGLPWFVTAASNRWTVERLDAARCKVRSQASLDIVWWLRPLGFVFRFMMRAGLREFVEEMIFRIERGEPHPRKRTSMRAQPNLTSSP